jgi:hypothetical protein
MKLKKKLRKAVWVFHEIMSPLGPIVWLDHRIQEVEEAIQALKQLDGSQSIVFKN